MEIKPQHQSWWNFARISPPVLGKFWCKFDPGPLPRLDLGDLKPYNLKGIYIFYKTKGCKLTQAAPGTSSSIYCTEMISYWSKRYENERSRLNLSWNEFHCNVTKTEARWENNLNWVHYTILLVSTNIMICIYNTGRERIWSCSNKIYIANLKFKVLCFLSAWAEC